MVQCSSSDGRRVTANARKHDMAASPHRQYTLKYNSSNNFQLNIKFRGILYIRVLIIEFTEFEL